jgi:hypothetical protein
LADVIFLGGTTVTVNELQPWQKPWLCASGASLRWAAATTC